MTNEYVFTPIQFDWNITESDKSEPIYKKLFSKKYKLKQLNYFLKCSEYAKTNKIHQTLPLFFLRNTFHNMEYTTHPHKSIHIDTNNNKLINYNFVSGLSIIVHVLLYQFSILPDDKFLIYSRLNHTLDGLWYHLKFHKLYKPNIDYYLFYFQDNFREEQMKRISEYIDNIYPICLLTTILDNTWVDKQTLPKYNLIFFEYWTLIDLSPTPHTYIRNCQTFDSNLTLIILSLKHLKKGGSIIIYTPYLSTRITFHLFHYLANYFELVKTVNQDTELMGLNVNDTEFIIMKNYKGNADIQKLRELNKRCFELDPTGGLLYTIDNKKLIKQFFIKDTRTEKAKGYIISLGDDGLFTKYYKMYKKHMKWKMSAIIYVYNIYISNTENNYEENKIKATLFAQKHDLQLTEWALLDKTNYMKKYITYLSRLDATMVIKMELNETPNKSILLNNYELYEKSFMYMMKIDNKKYKEIELFINSIQKLLHKTLKTEYRITVNNKPVSRAWKKLFELIHDTKFLDNYDADIYGFHICEAPGNFINAIHTYIIMNKPDINYTWNAQSLSEDFSGFGDMYGFMNKTIDKWDMGNGSGDIMNLHNKKHYYEKYKGCTVLIGDCGMKWDKNSHTNSLSVEQMYYAILFPKKGGSFIIKANCIEVSEELLFLLWTAYNYYAELYVCGSNTNFWSPEIYIIGKNKHNDNQEYLHSFLKGQKITGNVPSNFTNEYIRITQLFIKRSTSIRRFFVFLVTYPEYFNKYKDDIKKIFMRHNVKWIKQYIS